MKNRKRASTPNIVAALLAALLATLPCLSAFAEEETGRIVENEWNYVDASMDVSGGIPGFMTACFPCASRYALPATTSGRKPPSGKWRA